MKQANYQGIKQGEIKLKSMHGRGRSIFRIRLTHARCLCLTSCLARES